MSVDDPIFSSNALAIATDDNFDAQGDAYDGSLTKVEPSAGEIAQGAIRPGRQIGAQAVNWILNQFSQIFSALIANAVEHEDRLDDDDVILADHETRLDTAEAWILNSSPRIKILEFLTSGSFTVPPRCVAGLSYGCGGGGAGGGGRAGVLAVDRWSAGGAGGGGAWATMQPLRNLVPGELINVDVGAGGLPYTVSLGGTGGDGGDGIVRRGSTALATHRGAAGGRGAVGGQAIADWNWFTMGGTAVTNQQIMLIGPAGQGIRVNVQAATLFGAGANGMSLYFMMQPAQGGYGAGGSQGPTSGAGSRNPTGNFAGGAGGIKGPDGRWDFQDATPYEPGFDTRRGGGGGGGGGAGPFGPGGQGGPGQYGDPWSAPQPTEGGNAGANSGAGGGGGGSCGYFDDVEDVGGNNSCFGGNGGSGRQYIILVQESGT